MSWLASRWPRIRANSWDFKGLMIRFWPVLLIAVLAVLALASWYRGRMLLWGIDANVPLSLQGISDYFRITDVALGAPDVRKLPFALPIGGLLWAWDRLGVPYDAATLQRILLFALLVISGVSMYVLIRTFLSRLGQLPALAGALFYMFNLYALVVIWTPLSNLLFHYSLLPLVVALWIRTLRRKSPGLGVITAIAWTFCLTPGYITLPVVVTDFLLLGGVAFLELRSAEPGAPKRRLVLTLGVMASVWLVLNLYWIVPLAFFASVESTRGLASGNPADLIRLNSATFGRAIRLGGYWGLTSGYKGSPYFPWAAYYESAGGILGYVLPLLAVLGLIRRPEALHITHCPRCGVDENHLDIRGTRLECMRCGLEATVRRSLDDTTTYLRFFGIVLLVSLLLVTGPNEPLGQVKTWVMTEGSAFGPFRSVYQRFMVYATLAYAPLLAGGIYQLLTLTKRIRIARFRQVVAGAAGVTVAVVLAVGLPLPMWTGDLFNRSGVIPSGRIDIPSEYPRVAEWLDDQEGDFVVLTYPSGPTPVTALDWDDGNGGYLGIEPLSLLTGRPVLLRDDATSYLTALVGQAANGESRAWPALRLLNVRYIVVHLDVNAEYLRGVPNWVGADVGELEMALSQTPRIDEVFQAGRLRVYEVLSWRPFRLFSVDGYSGKSIYAMPFNAVNPAEYKVLGPGRYLVQGGQLDAGDTLVVNHPYDEQWSADGASPLLVQPGLTGFRASGDGPILVEHELETRFPLLLAIVPTTLAALLAGGLIRLSRRRNRGVHAG